MFHDFVPNGLPQVPRKSNEPSASSILKNVKTAVEGIKERSVVYQRSFNSVHPDTYCVVKALDKFFSHGLILDEKCYWPFIKNFVTHYDESQLRSSWRAKRSRGMSLAWLKDALNSKSLHFQCGAILTCDRALIKKYYHDTACIKNPHRLEKFLNIIVTLNDINFDILAPADTSYESVPIALPSTSIDEPVALEVSDIRANRHGGRSNAGGQRVAQLDPTESSELTLSQSLLEMTRDLGPIEVRDAHEEPSNFENYQQYMFEKVTSNCQLFNPDYESDHRASDSASEVPASTVENQNVDADSEEIAMKDDFTYNEGIVIKNHDDVNDECEKTPEFNDAPVSNIKCSQVIENFNDIPFYESVAGMVNLENYEIIALGLSIFVDQGEPFRKCFIVYTGHAVGRPLQRLLILTDRRLYLLSYHVSGTNVAVEASTSPQSFGDMRGNMKFENHANVKLNDIDFVFVGADYQSFTIESKTTKFTTPHSDHESRNLTIETGSMILTNTILTSVQKAIVEECVYNPSIDTDGTPNVITLRKFVNTELNTTNTVIMHHVMAYWVEFAASANASKTKRLEGYFMYREVRPKNWISPFGEWKNAFFVLTDIKLYQFVDSTCKIGEQVWNLRNHFELVQDVELRNEENHVFQLTACDSTFGIQFICPNIETKRTWIHSVNIALSNFDSSPPAVPCSLVIADDTLIFAQEGANCAVDGFMRLLKRIDIADVADVVSVHTESVFVIVVENKNASTDWVVLRTEPELRRLESTLLKCGIQVTDSVDAQNLGGDKSNILYNQCIKMNDYWRNAPVDDEFDVQAAN